MGNALVTLNPEQFPALRSDVGRMIAENMGGEAVSPADLGRIKVPAGGGGAWNLPDGNAAKSVVGVIVHITRRRAYWKNPDPTGERPDCSSSDMVYGSGDPGGVCDGCPHNEWGSAVGSDGKERRGKACGEKKMIFLLREGQVLPEVVEIPPASLPALRKYQLALSAPYWAVVTRLEINVQKSKDGIKYAEVIPTQDGVLEADQATKIRSYAEDLASVFEKVEMSSEAAGTKEC